MRNGLRNKNNYIKKSKQNMIKVKQQIKILKINKNIKCVLCK